MENTPPVYFKTKNTTLCVSILSLLKIGPETVSITRTDGTEKSKAEFHIPCTDQEQKNEMRKINDQFHNDTLMVPVKLYDFNRKTLTFRMKKILERATVEQR